MYIKLNECEMLQEEGIGSLNFSIFCSILPILQKPAKKDRTKLVLAVDGTGCEL